MKKQMQQFKAKASQKDQFCLIDIIRLILALIILNFHAYREYYNLTIPHSYYGGGWLVVDAFFIISGFFLALSSFKDDTPSYPRFMFRKVFRFAPMLLIAWIQGIVISMCLWAVKGYSGCWKPIEAATMGLWFVWALWISEFIFYPIIKYCKKAKYPLIALVMLIGVAGYVYVKVASNFVAEKEGWMFWVLGFSRSFLSVGLGVIIQRIYIALKKKYKLEYHAWFKTIFTIIGLAAAGGSIYLMFWKYTTPWIFMTVTLFFIVLLISFCKLGWISNHLWIPDKVSLACRKLSSILYIYQFAFFPFIGAFYKQFTAFSMAVIYMVVILLFSVPFYYIAPHFTKWFISKCKHLNKI